MQNKIRKNITTQEAHSFHIICGTMLKIILYTHTHTHSFLFYFFRKSSKKEEKRLTKTDMKSNEIHFK